MARAIGCFFVSILIGLPFVLVTVSPFYLNRHSVGRLCCFHRFKNSCSTGLGPESDAQLLLSCSVGGKNLALRFLLAVRIAGMRILQVLLLTYLIANAACAQTDTDALSRSAFGVEVVTAKDFITDNSATSGRKIKLPKNDAVVVSRVYPESPAAKAGIQQDDLIEKIGAAKTTTAAEFFEAVAKLDSGKEINLTVRRPELKGNKLRWPKVRIKIKPQPFKAMLLSTTIYDQKIKSVFTGEVVSISDGDTLSVYRGDNQKPVKIRFASVDAPESDQPFGQRAKQALSERFGNKQVEVWQTDKDRHGRIVGFVCLTDRTNASVEMLKQGMAWHYKSYSKSKELGALETAARGVKLGLWGDADPVEPWAWRKKK